MCSCSDGSAGKRRAIRIRQGAPWLKTTLIQAALAAARTNELLPALDVPPPWVSAWRDEDHRRGGRLRSAYHMLTQPMLYQDLGPGFFEKKPDSRTATDY